MDIRELAAYLRLERQTLYNWLHQKKIAGIKVGGVWRFDRRAIDQWLKAQTVRAATPRSNGAVPGNGGR
ncbi:MAG: helix-turn-helix domain-containing protein [Candidatus Omnitrophica bacterium]|nr:helix-turn-helix domain-containing protein [Candidatus Omnitrophota bacterium]